MLEQISVAYIVIYQNGEYVFGDPMAAVCFAPASPLSCPLRCLAAVVKAVPTGLTGCVRSLFGFLPCSDAAVNTKSRFRWTEVSIS